MTSKLIHDGYHQELPKRGLTLDTCRKWGYEVGTYDGEPVQIANYRAPDGTLVAQKVRFKNKDFKFLGDTKEAGLYGEHLWRDGGKRVIVTEGEIDALSVSQVLQHKWQVVSLPNGAQGARKSLAKRIEWLLQFDEVVLCFDQDDAGRKAVEDCATLFPPGRLKVVTLPLKDANDMLVAKRADELIQALWDAKTYRPDGIVKVSDLRERVLIEPTIGLPWWCPRLTEATYGRRYGEAYALGAGTGVGKSDWIAQQIAFDVAVLQQKVGLFALEQQPEESLKRISGKVKGRLFHIPGTGWSKEELSEALDVIEPNLFLYDHFGACDWEVIRDRIRYLAHSEGVRIFYLDHLTALAAAADDERIALEQIMAEIGGLVKELNIIILFVSHLSTPDGKPHEEGGRVMIRHFKGSRAIGYWSHFMFGIERDQQAEDEDVRQTTTFRVLKDRYTGQATGLTIDYRYHPVTGRLEESSHVQFHDQSEDF